MKWICSQIGAREHYAIPRVLHRNAKLERLYTDLWGGTMWKSFGSFLGSPAYSNRYHVDLADAKVESFDLTTIVDSTFGGSLKEKPFDWFLYVGSDFGKSVLESLKRKKGIDWKKTIFFGYDTGFLEPGRWVKAQGGRTVVCQMDPSRFEVDLVREEAKHWPGWSKGPVEVPENYFQRREQEWAAADLVMVNSGWTKKALIQQGVNKDKIVIVPLAYELGATPKLKTEAGTLKAGSGDKIFEADLRAKPWENVLANLSEGGCRTGETKNLNSRLQVDSLSVRPLRVLYLGQVILRKGIQYLIEAARLLEYEPVKFDIVGALGISDQVVKSAPANMIFHGATSRDCAPKFFANADLFVLPTISDGFALTQLEAMASGLPVIATPNCGEVVTHGQDGLIVPARDARLLADSIRSLIANPEKLQLMSIEAIRKAELFNLTRLGEILASLERRLETQS